MVNILHLTDLHFGYEDEKDETAKKQRKLALDGLVETVRGLEKDWKPDLLAVTGDLAWKGRAGGYAELGTWLTEKVLPAAGLTAGDCVFCPGNHDLERKKAKSLEARTADAKRADELLRPEEWMDGEGFSRPFELFVKFVKDFGGPAPQLHGADCYLSGAVELKGIRLAVLNSAWFCRDSNTDRGNLWLGLPIVQVMGFEGPEAYNSGALTVGLLHHPPDWVVHADSNCDGDRPNTMEFLASRTHVLLSGHVHGAVERGTKRYARAWHFVGGASYADNRYRNNFAVLRIDPPRRRLTRRAWEFDPRKPEWVESTAELRENYSLVIDPDAKPEADPGKYLNWLRSTTELIPLEQLKGDSKDSPRPLIEELYFQQHGSASGAGLSGPPLLLDALRHARLVIEGPAGSGKTTFLKWIAWMLCRLAGPPADFPVKGFPAFVRVSQLDAHISKTLAVKPPREENPAQPADARWFGHFLSTQGWGLDEEFWREQLGKESTVLLLDGLDEAADQLRRAEMMRMLELLAAQTKCRIVLTTRPGVYEGRVKASGFEQVTIPELDTLEIHAFLMQWSQWLHRRAEPATQEYFERLREAVRTPSIRLLAGNPLMLTALAVLHGRRHRLPEQRAQLYKEILDWLAEQAEEKYRDFWKSAELLERLGRLALAMQNWKGNHTTQLSVASAASAIARGEVATADDKDFVERAQQYSGILTLRGAEVAFWHKSFQEYLSARTLAGLLDPDLVAKSTKLLYSEYGREVLPLLAGHLQVYGPDRLDELFTKLLESAVWKQDLADQAYAAGIVGNMLSDLTTVKYALPVEAAALYGRLQKSVTAIFDPARLRDIPLETRARAAEALDQANQSRLYLPHQDAYWIPIPADTYPIGGDKGAFASLPKRKAALSQFFIGRYPVTVWEYGKFLEATKYEEPLEWEVQKRNPGRPVTRISKSDAEAYCKFAGARLPMPEEWEAAARGLEGRVFPWGEEEPTEFHANFEGNVGETSPVGLFPDGNTPEGVSDLAGNVWEWTSSEDEAGGFVLRGGSGLSDAANLRAACRGCLVPELGHALIGFRCSRE